MTQSASLQTQATQDWATILWQIYLLSGRIVSCGQASHHIAHTHPHGEVFPVCIVAWKYPFMLSIDTMILATRQDSAVNHPPIFHAF